MRLLAWMLPLVLLVGNPVDADFGRVYYEEGVLMPETTVEYDSDRGQRAHTNHLINLPASGLGPGGGMTPAQIRSFYNLPSTGGGGTIAIVDAYDYPTALSDFNVFSSRFGLPTETSTNPIASTNHVFQVVYASGQPPANASWGQEEAIDIEWAHALAPGAKIVLVEARSSSLTDLLTAVDVARNPSIVPNVTQVSMSWGTGEFTGETTFDSHFPQANGIAYFVSSGDTGGASDYPAASPYVVAVGGTSLGTNSSGVFVSETGWSGSGGGPSAYEPKPSYQNGVANTPAKRGIPDVSCDADPYTGVSVYDSTAYQGLSGWIVFGGTSVSAPCVAGMANLAGGAVDTQTLLKKFYVEATSPLIRDITSGTAGSFSCTHGWDFVTGVGSTPAACKLLPDGASVTLTGMVVSGVFPGKFYAESQDRSFGIQVVFGQSVNSGAVQFAGTLLTDSAGERYVSANNVSSPGSGSVAPVFLANKAIGGADWHYDAIEGDGQRGIAGASGLNNLGLLVRASGKVTYSTVGYFYIDDGSGLQDGSGNTGVKVYAASPPAQGSYVGATGISSCELLGSTPIRVLRTRAASDVAVMD